MLDLNEKKVSSKKVKSLLHHVEGFYPESELMEVSISDESGLVVEKKYYLPLSVKETWFWLVYPEGAIRTVIKDLKESYVRAECKLYRHYKDTADEYFCAAEKIMSINYNDYFYQGRTKEEIMGGYINAAKAGAESIALSKGGFGIQIESPEESDMYSDKRYEERIAKIPLPKMDSPKFSSENKANHPKEQKNSNKNDNAGFIPFSPVKNDNKVVTTPAFGLETKNEQRENKTTNAVNRTIPLPTATLIPNETEVKNEQENEETISIEEAKSIVTTCRNVKFAGKTLGQIFTETPLAIPYIAYISEGREKEAATVLSNSTAETKAKLEQYIARG